MPRANMRTDGLHPGAAIAANLSYLWSPLVPQSPINAKSDYFDNASLDAKWTEVDPDAHTTITEGATRLKMVQTTHAGVSCALLAQTAPAATRYCITADLRMSGQMGTAATCFVWAGEDLISNPGTDGFVFVESVMATGPDYKMDCASYTDYETSTTVHFTVNDSDFRPRLLRIYVDTVANTYDLLTSEDGLEWYRLGQVAQAATTVVGDPQTIGIGLQNLASGADLTVYCSMFRVDEVADPYHPIASLRA